MGSNACNPLSQTMLSGIIWFRQGDGKQGDSGMVNGSATSVAELRALFHTAQVHREHHDGHASSFSQIEARREPLNHGSSVQGNR